MKRHAKREARYDLNCRRCLGSTMEESVCIYGDHHIEEVDGC